MKCGFSFIICCIIIFLITAPCVITAQGGLIFRSYDKNQDDRTSLTIPASNNKLKFNKYLSVSFDFMVRTGPDRFGYVCRIIIGNQSCIDVMLNNPVNEDPHLCLIKDRHTLHKVERDNKPLDINKWNRISIEIMIENDSLVLKENGVEICTSKELPINRTVGIYFGANSLQGFATTDVAPTIIKNVAIGLKPDKTKYFWELYNADSEPLIYDKLSGMAAAAANCDWNINNHIHWRELRQLEFPSKVFAVTVPSTKEIFFITRNSVTRFESTTDRVTQYDFAPDIQLETLSCQFIYNPYTEQLVLYDFEQPEDQILSTFDFNSCKWSHNISRDKKPINLHHSRFISPVDSSLVQLFGYGFHKYSRTMNRITPSGEVSQVELSSVSPRYLSCVGMADSLVYIYGGVGNEIGKQEYGTHVYNDLYKLRLSDLSIEKLWDRDSIQSSELATTTMIVDPDGKRAKALFFTPRNYQSYLILKEIDLTSGETTPLADTIPYLFRDIESMADLLYNDQVNQYFAVTVNRTEGKNYQANIYTINTPALPIQTGGRSGSNTTLYVICALIVSALAVYAYRYRAKLTKRLRRKFKATHNTVETVGTDKIANTELNPIQQKQPGIYLVNGFQIINKQLEDITVEFTPIMSQLLSLIILYSNRDGKGISNARLKEFLWFDKSEESSRNNRSVHISKIRMLLEAVGDFEITSINGNWLLVVGENSYCDYTFAKKYIRKHEDHTHINDEYIAKILEIASWGNLLPNMQFDWLDGFKADYSDSLINIMVYLRDSKFTDGNYKVKIMLADGILQFDSLDETSICTKCHALFTLKRVGTARSTFDMYVKEYEQVMGQKPKITFEQAIS